MRGRPVPMQHGHGQSTKFRQAMQSPSITTVPAAESDAKPFHQEQVQLSPAQIVGWPHLGQAAEAALHQTERLIDVQSMQIDGDDGQGARVAVGRQNRGVGTWPGLEGKDMRGWRARATAWPLVT